MRSTITYFKELELVSIRTLSVTRMLNLHNFYYSGKETDMRGIT